MTTYLAIFVLTLSLLVSAARPAYGQQSAAFGGENLRFKHISIEQGLANTRILSILQDRQGFMWFGTAEGLNRFDGQDFVLLQSDADDPSTLSNNVIWTLYEDRTGYIWIGTSGGLNRYDPATETITRYLHDATDPTSLADDTVNTVYEDQSGILWVGTGHGGLDRYDRESERFIHYQNDPADPQSLSHNEVTGIGEDRAGTLWISTYGGGLNQLVPGKSANDPPTFRHFQHDPANPQSLSHDEIEVMNIDAFGYIWLGTWGGGLNRFDVKSETFTRYEYEPDDPDSLSSNTISAIATRANGDLWVGTWDGGVNHFNRTSETFVRSQNDPADPSSLTHNAIRSLFISRDDLLYIGTAGGGVNQLDLRPNPFRYLSAKLGNPNSLSQNDVRSVLQDRQGVLWIGTQSAGLDSFDPNTGLATHYRNDPDDPASLSNNSIWSLAEDREGNLWVGTFGGLNKFERASGRFVRYLNDPANPQSLSSDRVYTLYEDHSGTLWIGTYSGLDRFDRQTESFVRYQSIASDANSLSNDSVQSIAEDTSGTLWVGTQGGLNRLDAQTGTFTRYMHNAANPSSIGNDTVAFISSDPSGVLWLGTYGGLDRFDPRTGRALHYTTQDGMKSNIVWQVMPDEQGNLWLGTPNGLNRFNLQTTKIRAYDASSGLSHSTFNARAIAKNSSGELLLGSGEGLLIFSPSQLREEVHTPPLIFTGFELANRPVPIGNESRLQQSINDTRVLKLSYLDRVISFSFAALEYRAPQSMRYRYALRGFETQWTETNSKRRYVTYTNLAPGSYEFVVQIADSNGRWITPGRSITLTVVPPWWQSLWFRLALGGVLLLTIAGAYRFRVMMLQQRNRDLENQVERRTTALTRLNTELEQRLVEISTLNQIAHVLNRPTPLEVQIEELVVIITNLFHSVGAAICLTSTDQSQLHMIDYHRLATPAPAGETTKKDRFELATISISLAQPSPLNDLFADRQSVVFRGEQSNAALSALWPFAEPPNYPHIMFNPIVVRDEVAGVIALAAERPEEDFTPAEVALAETIAIQLAAAVENSWLFEQEIQQRAVAEARSIELSTLLNISQDVSSMFELEPLLNMILFHLAQVIDFSTLLMLELTGDELFILAKHGVESSAISPSDEFPATWLQEQTPLFENREPLMWADLDQEPEACKGMRRTFGVKMALLLQKTHSCMIVPLVTRDKIVGLFWFGHIQRGIYSAAQAEYITAVAHQAAIAIENAHYYQAMQTAAADRERNRLAQELHDSVSQNLLAANKVAETLPTLWEQSPDKGKQALGQLRIMIQSSLAEMRTLMLELRPAILAQKPLGELLRQLCDGFAGRALIRVVLEMNGDAILPAICQVCFYRIAQAAFDNIQQHAQASVVKVNLDCTPKYVEMHIADDGVGMDLVAVPPDRMGLNIMRERAERIGATFRLESKPGEGTHICLRYDYPNG